MSVYDNVQKQTIALMEQSNRDPAGTPRGTEEYALTLTGTRKRNEGAMDK